MYSCLNYIYAEITNILKLYLYTVSTCLLKYSICLYFSKKIRKGVRKMMIEIFFYMKFRYRKKYVGKFMGYYAAKLKD